MSRFHRGAAHPADRGAAPIVARGWCRRPLSLRFLAATLFGLPGAALAQSEGDRTSLTASVQQLRETAGEWSVVTSFLNPDGSVARAVEGSYRFDWVIPDRVLSGRSEIPSMQRTAAILFYVSDSKKAIEMVSVGADGNLWIMSGPLGGETRYTQKYQTQDGGEGQLRFTRSNVTPAGFESRMEFSEDGGKTWKPGNHQVFRRKT